MTARNALCPCGSGKKYKKCCSLSEWENRRSCTEDVRSVEEQAKALGFTRCAFPGCETFTGGLEFSEGLESDFVDLQDLQGSDDPRFCMKHILMAAGLEVQGMGEGE